MNILYLSTSYVPSRSASSVHVMKMCAALARNGHAVELITKGTPERQEKGVEDVFAFYGVEAGFAVTRLPRPHRRGGGLAFLHGQRRLLKQRPELGLVYSRDLAGAWLAARQGHTTIFEAHGLPSGRLARFQLRALIRTGRLHHIVFISEALRRLWVDDELLAPQIASVVAHDAADPLPPCEEEASPRPERTRVGYVGHLYAGRGVELILEAARRLPRIDFDLVGGSETDLHRWLEQAHPANINFHGFVAPARLPGLYRSFDILLMPYQRSVSVRSGRSDTARWMSPMKMFEYLSTGRPIVSSDLPVLREVLENERNALLVDPEDQGAWVSAIERLEADAELRARLGSTALRDFSSRYTWTARAQSILEGVAP